MLDSKKYRNELEKDPDNPCLVSIYTIPQVAIGQRAILCCTPLGNILWDCITYIDDETVKRIQDLGGIAAIVISHPHYYSTCLHWTEAFNCKVYLSADDEEWVMRRGPQQEMWREPSLQLLPGDGDPSYFEFMAVKTGGHFPGSSVLWWKRTNKLLVADTITVVPSGLYHIDRPPNTVSFTFMWSYPNFIPLHPDEIHNIWKAIKDLDFEDTHGAFLGRDTRGNSKRRVLDSAKIIIKAMGHPTHAIHHEKH
ncbi:hypothetical protein Egran_03284 [Elaphomyces granulatus]|uniref:Metallo-beta-lactamase domain-containing protein n=1 Tax=Elaphomyces granulatus TaxID=519963 RepID=A0A232LXQ9_9EURO|nr:hypothetical protein Egran_03284 [Elaphomyces granulatus]